MSLYPTNETLPVEESAINLLNRNYHGYTFKQTVEKHLIKFNNSIKESIDFCNCRIKNSKTESTRSYWRGVLSIIESVIAEPHSCNIDYTLFMIKDMPIEEIVSKYDKVTIGDIKKARQL